MEGELITTLQKRGFVFQSYQIYGGLSGFFDLGPLGVKLKNNLIDSFRDFFLKDENLKIYEIESRLLVPEILLKASGHLNGFFDPIVECKSCKSVFRADHLIEEELGIFVEGKTIEEINNIIKEKNLKCKCGGEFSDVKIFKLLFESKLGVKQENVYLRPETAQNIFVNFLNIVNSMRVNLPFGIMQIGYSFRNEISPRQFLIRLREFTQIEIEFFFNPEKTYEQFNTILKNKIPVYTREEQEKKSNKVEIFTIEELIDQKILPNNIFGYFLVREFEFYKFIGIPENSLRFRHLLKEETPFYSKGNLDLEIKFDFGWKEVVGNAYRSDYDLKQHSKFSNKEIFIVEEGKKIVPHVIEPSFGIERTLYAIFQHSFKKDNREWYFFKFKPRIAPIKVSIFPLVKKDGLDEVAKKIYKDLKNYFDCIYEEKDSIGKRYARADEIGIPFAITIDYQTLEDNTVTIRNRDNSQQFRVKIEELKSTLQKLLLS